MTSGSRTVIKPAAFALSGAIAFAAVIVALHVLRSDLDPVRDDLSMYAVGRFGSLMAAGFVALGASVVATAVALSQGLPPPRGLRAARVLLGVSGVAGAVVAAFPTVAATPETLTDYAEVTASVVFFVGFGVASGIVSWTAWTGRRRVVAAALSGAFAVFFICMLAGPEGVHGLLMRVAASCVVAWVIVNAIWLLPRQEA